MQKNKTIYFVQVDYLRETPTFFTAYLPYTIGLLWAYAKQSSVVAQSYVLGDLFFLRNSIDKVVAGMQEPFLVGFSCYAWNTQYNKALAQAIKARFPRCLILFSKSSLKAASPLLLALLLL